MDIREKINFIIGKTTEISVVLAILMKKQLKYLLFCIFSLSLSKTKNDGLVLYV